MNPLPEITAPVLIASRSALLIHLQSPRSAHRDHDALINYHNYTAYIKMKLGPRMRQQAMDEVLFHRQERQSMPIWKENHTLNLNSMMSPSMTT